MYRIVTAVVLSLLLFSCSNGGDNRIKELTCISSVSELSDTLFLAEVKNLVATERGIFFIDKYRNQIVLTDADGWTLKSQIGMGGEGPDELCSLSGFLFRDDVLYALDGGCGKLVAYDLQGEICAKYSLPLESRLMTGYRFLMAEGDKMKISTTSEAGAFVELDLPEDGISFDGKRFSFDYTSQDCLRNGRYLLETVDGYLAVSDNMPQIERFDNQKKQVEVYDYSAIPVVKKRLLQIERENLDTNSYGIVCEDAYVHKGKLYLLLVSNEDEGFAVNRIAVFSLSPKIEWEGMLVLPGRVYSTFCVSDTRVIAFESRKNRLEAFQL